MKQYKTFKIRALELEEILEKALAEKYPEIVPLTKDNFDITVRAMINNYDHEGCVEYITLEILVSQD